MKPNDRLNTRFWIALDLLAIALMAGVIVAVYRIAIGAWWPSDEITVAYWPLLAFGVWVMLAMGGGALIGLQMAAIAGSKSVPVTRRPVHTIHVSAARGNSVRPEAGQVGTSLIKQATGPRDLLQAAESEESEPELAGAGSQSSR
jgi:hypothetical protein